MGIVRSLLKRNPLAVNAYDKVLDFRTRATHAYIFAATTGRSGTKSLTKIFESAVDAACFHEPHPIMFNDYPAGADKERYFRRLFFTQKRVHIKRSAIGHKYYLETNHQFIKNFVYPAVECFKNKIRIIHILRDPVKVAASFYAINSIPCRTHQGRYYLLNPFEDDNLIKIPDLLSEDGEFSDDIYKCIWYWYEVNTRAKLAKQRCPHVQWFTMTTDDFNDKAKMVNMLETLGVEFDYSKLESVIGIRENTCKELKKNKLELEKCSQMHDRLLEQMEDRYGKGFWISDLSSAQFSDNSSSSKLSVS